MTGGGAAPGAAVRSAVLLPAPGAPGVPRRLLGLGLRERTLLALLRAGVGRILVAAGDPEEVRAAALARRLPGAERLAAGRLADAAAVGGESRPLLAAEEGAVFDPLLAEELLARSGGPEAQLVAAADGSWTGLALVAPSLLPRLAAGEGLEELARAGGGEAADAGGRLALRVRSPGTYREARRRLLQSVRKPTDGFVSRTFNRPVSLQLTRVFLAAGVTPNQISLLGLAVGLAAAGITLAGSYGALLAGAALFQLGSILDGSDGEAAKLTGRASPFGSWVDTMCDQAATLAYFAALPAGVARGSGDPRYLLFLPAMVACAAAMYAVMIHYMRATASHGSMVQILEDYREAARGPGLLGLLGRTANAVSFVFRRDFFSMAVLLACLAGAAAAVVWSLAAALALAVPFLALFSALRRAGRRGGPRGTGTLTRAEG